MSRKQEKHGKEKETIKGWKMNTHKHTQKSSNEMGNLERNGICKRFKMILEGEERMRMPESLLVILRLLFFAGLL